MNDLQDTIGTSRKYKSCLSFIPSKVKHISILSGESPTQRFRGFMNLIGIMFVILNLRNIIDNFVKYGVRFQRSPSDFIALDTIVAIFGLLLFPIMIHLVEKIKFKKYASKGFCVRFCPNVEIHRNPHCTRHSTLQHQVLLTL